MHNEMRMDDEISLSEIWAVIRRYKYWVLGVPVVAMVAATVLVFFVLKPEWEATALIQIGQVAEIGQVGQTSTLTEPIDRVVARISQPSFLRAVLESINMPNIRTSPAASLYRHTFKVQKPPNAPDLIQIVVRGYSPQQANQFSAATVAYLRHIHDMLAAPTVQRLRLQLTNVETQIAQIKRERASLVKHFQSKPNGSSTERLLGEAILANTVTRQDSALRDLEDAKLTYEEKLSPERTYPTSLVGDIDVSQQPVFPKKSLTILLSAILGLMGGLFMAFALNLRQQLKAGAR